MTNLGLFLQTSKLIVKHLKMLNIYEGMNMPSFLGVNVRLGFKDFIDLGFGYQGVVSRQTNIGECFGVSAGMRLIDSRLLLGLGFNDYKYLRLYSPYLIYSF
jgi:hypothetical protein